MAQTFQLFCLPYSGASASVYYSWRRKLPSWIDVQPVELPGRGARSNEKLETTMKELVGRILPNVLRYAHSPFGLFGHSMGAVLAYEVSSILKHRHHLEPDILFVSGTSAPTCRDDARYAQLQSKEQLVTELRELNGTRQEILGDTELMDMILPVLRADFAVCGSYSYQPRPRLSCPIQAVIGNADATSQLDRIQPWGDHTDGSFHLTELPGDHFFIHSSEAALLQLIRQRLEALTKPLRWPVATPVTQTRSHIEVEDAGS